MQFIATETDVTYSVVCAFGTRVGCAKMAEAVEMPFGGQSHVGPRNLVLDKGPDALT